MVGGLACGRRTAQVALDAVVANATDGHRTAFHLQVLLAVDTVTNCRRHVQRQVLNLDIRCRLDAVFQVACHVERAVALQLQLSFRVYASLLRTAAVGQGVGGPVLGAELYALRVGDVDGCSAGISQRHAGQRNGALIRAGECQRTVGGRAGEHIGNLVTVHGVGVRLRNGDMGTADGGRHIRGHMIGGCHCSRRAIVDNVHRIGICGAVACGDNGIGDVADGVGVSAYRHRSAVRE